MPSTMKCSPDDNLCVLACSNISGRIAAAASASSNRCRFLANSECSKLRSIMFEYKNHLYSPPGADTTAVCRTAARCTDNTPINRPAYSRRSDSISARPLAAYIRVKVGESLDNARSTLGLMRRMGWRASFPLISNTTLPRWPILPHGAHIGAIFNTLPGKPAISKLPGYVDATFDPHRHAECDTDSGAGAPGDDDVAMVAHAAGTVRNKQLDHALPGFPVVGLAKKHAGAPVQQMDVPGDAGRRQCAFR